VAQAATAPVIHRRKGLTPEKFTQTHGLPDPDGPLHKGSIFRQLLAPMRPGRMLDLGAGKGNFSLSAAELGWDVTAVDARTVRWPNADTEADPVVADRIRAIRWIQADVRHFPIAPGDYDLICILGLLHHLEVKDQIKLLKRCSGTLTLMAVRIAPKLTPMGLTRVCIYASMAKPGRSGTRSSPLLGATKFRSDILRSPCCAWSGTAATAK
jgi:SAM-dependent methyltransferase